MFDMGLHFHFLKKATEAFFELSQASMAATLSMQARVHQDISSAVAKPDEARSWPVFSLPSPHANPFSLTRPTDTSGSLQWQAWFESWMHIAPLMAQHSYGVPSVPPASWAFSWSGPAWPMLPVSPWTIYQGPMVACMLSYGVPYAVAAPAARASTSAMDAADAACTQFRLMFGNDNERSDAAGKVRDYR